MAHGSELFDLLRSLALPAGDFAVFGSGPLLARGIIETAGDLDVICRGPAWDRAQQLGVMVELADGARIASAFDGAITFGISWAYGDVDVDSLIDTADMIDGIPFVKLQHVIDFKRLAGRPKDLAHLRLLDDHRDDRSGEAGD